MHYITLNSKFDIYDTHKLFRKLSITYNFKSTGHLTTLAQHYKMGGWLKYGNIHVCDLGCSFKKQTFI